ncbi:hypothetical protein ABZX30_03950 [Streptomyces sp. NPDC004542]|uniref:hypothetical protein n=1 Tax=Streptomyces sp. NPDC004542 TaxID=3154281 RepID=UPI0033A4AAD5
MTAALLIRVTGGYRDHRVLTPTALVDAAEGCGGAASIAVGLAAMAAGQAGRRWCHPKGGSRGSPGEGSRCGSRRWSRAS